ncbi:Oidioi.mRNA.OKI2018_I69.XSR.g13265.t1.cds [Oikopleura dioica]|uniref:Oidioi.mRNA.OKI2018_I69.XSR.g13265.t1.cds n=1 Tax=Oikopleura dioica TaxID=34765 RepID=A0ABN7S6D5_OIKDI|nr:Oidioi.mRNA.OKI2018_I69.XSR.g13265.t1.cds [Oikopleura dioica]
MAHIKPVIATSQTSSGQDDTMQGIAEIASSQSTLSSAETPTPSTENSSGKNSNSGPSTTPFGADNNNEKPKSRTTSSFKRTQKTAGGDEDGPKAAAFGDEQNGDDNNNRKAGFHRDEHFQRRLDFFKDKEHPWIFDREYTYKHEEGPNAGEKVDLAYFNAHQKFLEKKRAMNSAKGGGFQDVTKIGENSGASSEADVPSCGSDTEEDETDKEDAGEMGAPQNQLFPAKRKRRMKTPAIRNRRNPKPSRRRRKEDSGMKMEAMALLKS